MLVTEWREFAELDWEALRERMAQPLIVDGRNFLDPERAARRGLRLRGHRAREAIRRASGHASRPRPASLMQAIVLVGGEGTRLRPLTRRVPKPAMTLVDRPFLAYMIEWLACTG